MWKEKKKEAAGKNKRIKKTILQPALFSYRKHSETL